MATGREGDTSLWLHNKLGTSNDTWVGGSICSQYNLEVLGNIRECFMYLQPQVKLKLLLSFFHIPRRNADEWHSELEEILELGRVDSDPWVAMVAEIMMPFPATGCLSEEFNASELAGQIFHTLLDDIRKIIQDKGDKGECGTLVPLESQYLNPNALTDLYGTPPQLAQHFKLKRKPKAAALRAELLNKSVEAANQLKKHPMPTVPLRSRGMPRKMTDNTPLKGIPSRNLSSFSRSTIRSGVRSLAGPKEGGIKLLDINEQPFGVGLSAAAKKKMKLDAEMAEKAAAAAAQAANAGNSGGSGQSPKAGSTTATVTNGVDDGKSPEDGLLANEDVKPKPSYAPETATSMTSATPSRSISTAGMADLGSPPPGSSADFEREQREQIQQQVSENLAILSDRKPAMAALNRELQAQAASSSGTAQSAAAARIFYATRTVGEASKVPQPLDSPPIGALPALKSASTISFATLQPSQTVGSQPGSSSFPAVALPSQLLLAQQQRGVPAGTILGQQVLKGQPVALIAAPMAQESQAANRTVQLPATSPGGAVTTVVAQQIPPPPSSSSQAPKKGLSLTREQMAEAQEMFRTANRVTRPEKALILGFMAGSRENPCPHLGNIVTIKLSEEQETLRQANGALVPVSVETLFQMNYNTGEWRRLRKQRSLQPVQ